MKKAVETDNGESCTATGMHLTQRQVILKGGDEDGEAKGGERDRTRTQVHPVRFVIRTVEGSVYELRRHCASVCHPPSQLNGAALGLELHLQPLYLLFYSE